MNPVGGIRVIKLVPFVLTCYCSSAFDTSLACHIPFGHSFLFILPLAKPSKNPIRSSSDRQNLSNHCYAIPNNSFSKGSTITLYAAGRWMVIMLQSFSFDFGLNRHDLPDLIGFLVVETNQLRRKENWIADYR